MATQGIVSVVSGNKMIAKIVAGCNGYHAEKLAEKIEERKVSDPEELFKLAREAQFGCDDCLVVITPDRVLPDDFDLDESPLYRETFDAPEFNPRWERGIAEHTKIVRI